MFSRYVEMKALDGKKHAVNSSDEGQLPGLLQRSHLMEQRLFKRVEGLLEKSGKRFLQKAIEAEGKEYRNGS